MYLENSPLPLSTTGTPASANSSLDQRPIHLACSLQLPSSYWIPQPYIFYLHLPFFTHWLSRITNFLLWEEEKKSFFYKKYEVSPPSLGAWISRLTVRPSLISASNIQLDLDFFVKKTAWSGYSAYTATSPTAGVSAPYTRLWWHLGLWPSYPFAALWTLLLETAWLAAHARHT